MEQDPGDSALSALRELGLTTHTDKATAARIMAELWIIDGRLNQDFYHKDRNAGGPIVRQHFYDAYHAIAERIVRADTPDEVLERVIPKVVHAFHIKELWRPRLIPEMMKQWLEGPVKEWKGKRLLMKSGLSAAIPASPQRNIPETLPKQIDRLRDECRLTVEQLAAAVQRDPTTVSRHLSGKLVPQSRTLSAYERVFSKKLERKIVLNKTPGKRR